ncbi:MAG: M48 family metallopeptidase [Rhodocyclaceae bacterium]
MPANAASAFSIVFLLAVAITTALRVWLSLRQASHVQHHRAAVPAAFRDSITLENHQKAADYTRAKLRLGLFDEVWGLLLLLAFTLGGGLQWLHEAWADVFSPSGYAHGIAFIASVGVTAFVVELPSSLFRTFVIEEHFGFNKLTFRLFIADLFKQALLSAAFGLPVLFIVLWLMAQMGPRWWLYVWMFWLGFNLLVMLIYPTLIAPLFNKFSPLPDEALKARIEALLARCGFRASGLFVLDGSRRSAHGNAYFTGFGAAKRIVFFDTLIEKLSPPEIEAVLAHELGHYKLRHVWKRLAVLAVVSLGFMWLLGFLIHQPWFFLGLGMETQGTAAALVLYLLVLPVFLFPLTPIASFLSRGHEFEADAYAARQAQSADLVSALVKLYRDNAATLTPDPLYSAFYDSHPPASVRVGRLQAARN